MSRRDLFLVAGTAAVSSFLTYLVCATVSAPPAAMYQETSAAHDNRLAPSDKPDVKAAHVETRHKGPAAAAASQHDSSLAVSANPSGNDPAQDPALAHRKRQELGERFSALFTDGSAADSSALGMRIENRFYLEEWNQEWAGSKESNIRTLFEHSENLSGVVPLQVACRSKNCQVVLAASSQDQVRKLSQQFMQAASKGDVGMKDKAVSFFPDISMGRLVFYVSENGNTDLFQ